VVRAADVEVVADDLLEEDPPGDGLIKHLGEGELGLQDRQVVAVAGGDVIGGERVRQFAQPFAQQGVDVRRAEAVADGLQRRRVPAANPLSSGSKLIPARVACRLAHSWPLMHSLAV
jgi:hypothetical protein